MQTRAIQTWGGIETGNITVVTILARVGTLNDCWDVAAPDKVIDSTQTYLSDWWTGRVMRVYFVAKQTTRPIQLVANKLIS